MGKNLDIRADERNYRIHGDKNKAMIRKSLEDCGAGRSIVVDNTGATIGGAGVLEQADAMGIPKRIVETDGSELVVVVRKDIAPDDPRRRALAIADNATTDLSEWDVEKLQQDFGAEELAGMGVDIPVYDPVADGMTDQDEVPDAEEKPESRRGAVYTLGKHRLMCGDSTSENDMAMLAGGEKAQLYLTDPPYNVNIEGCTDEHLTIMNDNLEEEAFLGLVSSAIMRASEMMDAGAAFYIFHSYETREAFKKAFEAAGLRYHETLTWVKNQFALGHMDYQNATEPILYGWKYGAKRNFYADRTEKNVIECDGQPFVQQADGKWVITANGRVFTLADGAMCIEEETDVIRAEKPKRNADHPTMKPVEMLVRFIRNSSRKNDVVLDSFAGSGSTLIACEKTRRRCLAMELDPKYCDVIRRRWAEFTHGKGCEWKALTPEGK